MLKVIGGDWPVGRTVHIQMRNGQYTRLKLFSDRFDGEWIRAEDIKAANLEAQENQGAAEVKSRWRVICRQVMRVIVCLFLIIDMDANRKKSQVAVIFRDGRKVLLEGGVSEVRHVLDAARHGEIS